MVLNSSSTAAPPRSKHTASYYGNASTGIRSQELHWLPERVPVEFYCVHIFLTISNFHSSLRLLLLWLLPSKRYPPKSWRRYTRLEKVIWVGAGQGGTSSVEQRHQRHLSHWVDW